MSGECSRRKLPVAPGLELFLVTQFRHEHEEGETFPLSEYLFGQRFHSPVVGLTHPQPRVALFDVRDLPRLKSSFC